MTKTAKPIHTLLRHAAAIVLLSALAVPNASAQNRYTWWDLSPLLSTWYLQVTAELPSGAKDDRSGVIGRIPGAAWGKDVHDIPAFASVNGAKVAVINLRGAEWGEAAGEYHSDYRPPFINGGAWLFTVITRDPNAQVTLAWDGLYEITPLPGGGFETTPQNLSKTLRRLRLIDLDSGRVVARGVNLDGTLGSYTFNMDGMTERHFRFVNGRPKSKHFASDDVVSIETISPLPLNFDAQLTSARSAGGPNGKTKGFGRPPELGVTPGEGVRWLSPLGANNPAAGQAGPSLFQPVERDGAAPGAPASGDVSRLEP